MPFILGLTGGIGSGKSAATAWFAQQGIDIVDADVIARKIVEKGQPALQKIHAYFGDKVLLENGELNRRVLREHIFNHANDRQILEQITHPIIRQSIHHQLQHATSPYVILVSPLLFETGQNKLVNRTLLIDTTEHIQVQRTMQRDTQSEEAIKRIIQTQMPNSEKRQMADDIVTNDGELAHLYHQLETLHQQYLQQAQSHLFNQR